MTQTTTPTDAPELSLTLRNIARYVKDIDANVPLYEALGFKLIREAGDMNVLEHVDGLQIILHRWDERPTTMLDTAIGFTLAGDAEDAKAYLEAAGWQLLREPHSSDVGYFIIYGDLDGNPINLVGKPTGQAPPPGTVKLVYKDGQAVAEY